jgi:hypothetical protein
MRHSTRPIIERLPHIAIKDIAKLIPRHDPNLTCNPDAYGWRYPGKVLLSTHSIKITDAAIVPQCFRLAWFKTGKGRHQPVIVCGCRRNTKVLYYYQGRYACRRCHKADYLCQRISKARNKLWQAARLRILLNGLPTDYKIPPKPRGQHRKTYLRLYDQIAQLEAKAHKAGKREFDTRLYAYHLSCPSQ